MISTVPNQPSFRDFMEQCIRNMCASLGIPREVADADNGSNYSSLRLELASRSKTPDPIDEWDYRMAWMGGDQCSP